MARSGRIGRGRCYIEAHKAPLKRTCTQKTFWDFIWGDALSFEDLGFKGLGICLWRSLNHQSQISLNPKPPQSPLPHPKNLAGLGVTDSGREAREPVLSYYMSYNRNSVKGVAYRGLYRCSTRVIKGDTRSLDCSWYGSF